MTDEQELNRAEAIDRLGGESRLSKLEERIKGLEAELDTARLQPGVRLCRTAAIARLPLACASSKDLPISDAAFVVIEAIGYDWVILRSTYLPDNMWCLVGDDIRYWLKGCL